MKPILFLISVNLFLLFFSKPILKTKIPIEKSLLLQSNDEENLDLNLPEGYVVGFVENDSMKNSNQTDEDEEDLDLDIPEGYLVGFSEIKKNSLENQMDAPCVRCQIKVCKIRIVLKSKCIKIFGKKICIKVPVIEKYNCLFKINPCLPPLICKIIGIIL